MLRNAVYKSRAMARRVTSGTGLPGDTGQYVAVSTAVWPLEDPRGSRKWRGSLKLRLKRGNAELLPPLFGSEKSGARYDRGTWQYWVVRLPLGIVAPALIFGPELKHHMAWLIPACLAGGIDTALGEKRRPGPRTRQCASAAVTSITFAAGMFGFAEILVGHRVLGGLCLAVAVAWGGCRRLGERLVDRGSDDPAVTYETRALSR
jgi:hypothetical protein